MTKPDYKTHIEPLEAKGLDNDLAIFEELAPRLSRNVLATGTADVERSPDLHHLLVGRYGVLWWGAGDWVGPLKSYVDALDPTDGDTPKIQIGFGKLAANLLISGRLVLCGSDGQTGWLVTKLRDITALIADGTPAIPFTGDAVRAGFDEVTGGPLFPDLVVADIAAARSTDAAATATTARRRQANTEVTRLNGIAQAATDKLAEAHRKRDYSQDVDHVAALRAAWQKEIDNA